MSFEYFYSSHLLLGKMLILKHHIEAQHMYRTLHSSVQLTEFLQITYYFTSQQPYQETEHSQYPRRTPQILLHHIVSLLCILFILLNIMFVIHPYCQVQLQIIREQDCIVFHYVDIPQFIYPFIRWVVCSLGILQYCYKYSSISF